MLGQKTYPTTFIDSFRASVDELLAHHGALSGAGASAFERPFCNSVVLVLDHCFMHRLRGIEGKDGNPLNEVRMLAAAILEHGCVLTADPTIRYRPEQSVTGLAIGDTVALDAASIRRLADAYFAEIERRFT